MSDFILLKSQKDKETGRVVELVNYTGGDGLMPVYSVKVDGVLVFPSDNLEQAKYEYSMECI